MARVQGDNILLVGLFEHRYLRSGQLALYSGRSGPVVRRRMNELIRLKLVIALEREPMHEVVYALTVKGYDCVGEFLELEGSLAFSSSTSKSAETMYLQHTLLCNDIRIAFAHALTSHPNVGMFESIPEWRIAESKARKPAQKYVLAEDFKSKLGDKKRTVRFRPDCLQVLYAKTQGLDYRAAYFVEADRSSQPYYRIREKYFSYMIYFSERRFTTTWKSQIMRVLFVIARGNPERRIHRMQEELLFTVKKFGADILPDKSQQEEFLKCFRFCCASELSTETVIDNPIWRDWRNVPIAIYKPSQRKTESKSA
ncbi:MAG: replication-relaxation family protein [Deltaproteobacteria bacterium]|nr:replication-relaxation family protein [Deltaproteobacteria bacterium]